VALMMKRRGRLEEEAEARRSTFDSLTPVRTQSTTAGIDHDEKQTQQVKENLIDMEATDDETLIPPRLQSLVLHLQLRPLPRSSLLLKPHAASDPPRGVLYNMSLIPLRSDHFLLPCLIFPFFES